MHGVHMSDVPLLSEEAQRGFFEASLERAVAVEAKFGAVERWFEVAGATLICTGFMVDSKLDATFFRP